MCELFIACLIQQWCSLFVFFSLLLFDVKSIIVSQLEFEKKRKKNLS